MTQEVTMLEMQFKLNEVRKLVLGYAMLTLYILVSFYNLTILHIFYMTNE